MIQVALEILSLIILKMNELSEKLASFEYAKKIMLKNTRKQKIETIYLKNAEDRILAEDIYSKVDIPHFDNSAVDGFGFKNNENNLNGYNLVGESKPGSPFLKKLNDDEAIRVFTGAYVIKKITGIDTICMEENAQLIGKTVRNIKMTKTGDNIRKKGEDVKKNKKIFRIGKKIRSIDLSQLCSIGIKKIKVYKKLKIGIFSSGDELCSNLKERKKYQIYDSNKLALISLFKKIGCEVVDLGIIKDSFSETKKKIENKLNKIDLLVTSGGVSNSSTDNIGKFLKKNGKIYFWRLSIKPGRPFIFGDLNKVPFIGLPGNPVAAIITFFMLVVDYIKKLSGSNEKQIISRYLPCDFNLKKKKGRTEWLRGSIVKKNNSYFLKKFPTTGSGIISSISQSEGVIELDKKEAYIKKGSILKFLRYEDMLN